MDFYSQIGQDKLVLKYLKNKKNGTFVDIGCGFPKHINNTYLLESEFNWYGISVDLISRRTTPEGVKKQSAIGLEYAVRMSNPFGLIHSFGVAISLK